MLTKKIGNEKVEKKVPVSDEQPGIVHSAFNKTEIGERYYKAIGKFTSREYSRRDFHRLRKPDLGVLKEIISEINKEQNTLFEEYLKRKK